ncbi:uncharacterized protein At4g00950-like [Cornus florida]|uniref:uncharacterized protein At4g00950-like n=1 Tax=Cornus florida TaxID=4283 RepID=UPI002899A2D5|nr:uncharacterized protein At4g00950-like [Cornus florida]
MGSEAEAEASFTPKLPLFLIPPMQSPEPSGMRTPPLQTYASVPFRWEEEPGKPRPCTTLMTLCNEPKCLDLPPRLLITESKITKTPSPTTVLDGPYVGSSSRSVFQSSSFRFIKEREGSFRRGGGASGRMTSPHKGHLGTMILTKRGHNNDRGFFGSWGQRTLKRKGSKKEGGGDSFVFSSSIDMGEESVSNNDRVKMTSIRRNGSFSSLSKARSHLWTAIYKGFKQAIPWNRKSKKEALII